MVDLPARGYRGRIHLGSFLRYRPLWLKYSGEEKLRNFQVKCVLTKDDIPFGKLRPDKQDLLFITEEGEAVPHFIAKADANEIVIFLKFFEIPKGTSILWLYYGNGDFLGASCGDMVFEFYDDFKGDALNTDIWYVSSPDYSVSNSILRINQGGIGMNDPLTFNLQEGYAVGTKCLCNVPGSGPYGGVLPEVSSSRFTAGGNSNADATAFPMRDYSSSDVKLWAASGSGKDYNIANGVTLFTSEENVWYLMSIRMFNGKLKIVKDDDIVFSETDINWQKNIRYVSLGHFGGDSDSNIQDTSYDFIYIRKYTEPEPFISVVPPKED